MEFQRSMDITNVVANGGGGGSSNNSDSTINALSRSLSVNTKKLYEFVLLYDAAASAKLSQLNQKMSNLERQMESLEFQMNSFIDPSQQF